MPKQPAVYILASSRNGTLYTGVTSDLVRRVWEHRHDVVPGFTSSYRVHSLVYYELHDNMYEAITREKQIKAGSRMKKIKLIETMNPEWVDLYDSLLG
ncbi:MAG: GIY-YIG nuclease family protein [Thiobacillaceae bacterium]|jgi:putative endonuclease|nr:GIY-YIG nuclease family protein [Thiobacillaceae bacterium]